MSQDYQEQASTLEIQRVIIKDKKFKPDLLRVQQGSTVEWTLQLDSTQEEYSLYYERSRSHVIAFD